jgi:hypothetical protein
MKKFILALLFIVSSLYAQFQSDNILTSPNAVWTDSRAYGSLSAAIAAIGANERTIVIAKQETVTNLTVPSNITLEFRKDGSIANSGTLTLQTKKIIAPDRQIFTGVGEIAFASGTIVRSSWFSNIESAIALTSTDTVTLVISKAQTLTASFAIGNNVQLKWESPGNILTANAGVTISNIRYVEAGDYQLFAGAGTFTFVDGINLNLRWFNSLRAALTWINITKANIRIPSAYVVDNNDTVPSNISLDFDHFNGSLSVSAGITLTLNCGIVSTFPSATIFTGLGTVTYSESTWLRANLASTASGKGAAMVATKVTGTGAVVRSVADKLSETISVKDFGAACDDGVTDDSAAVQAAVDYAILNNVNIRVPGKCRLASSVNIDREVDTMTSELRFIGDNAEAGFYTNGNVTMFDTNLDYSTDPKSEWVTFEHLRFESSSPANTSYVMSAGFLRIKFDHCLFYKIRLVNANIYAQTLHFINCNIRENPPNFITSKGSFDISFNHNVVENGNTLLHSLHASRGNNGLRFIDNLIEGMDTSTVIADGVTGVIEGNYFEQNASRDFDFSQGTLLSNAITVRGNYILNANGPAFYYGPTGRIVSSGNVCYIAGGHAIHANLAAVTDLTSYGELCVNVLDGSELHKSVVNGVTHAGDAASSWTDTDGHLRKSAAGEFGIGGNPIPDFRLTVYGKDSAAGHYMAAFFDDQGREALVLQNNRRIQIALPPIFANNAAALAGGLVAGQLYRTGADPDVICVVH